MTPANKPPKRIVANGLLLYEFVEDENKFILVAAVDVSNLDIDADAISKDFFESGILPIDIYRFNGV